MRFIYIDEAGKSAGEPVTVVVGLVVNADTQWIPTIKLIDDALATVPEEFRKGFIFHASKIWGSEKYRPQWGREDRAKFLHRMMAIPFRAGIGIAYAAVRRDAPTIIRDAPPGLPKEKLDHMAAFALCVGMADLFIRERGGPNEIATIVAEDVEDMRRELRGSVGGLRASSFNLTQQDIAKSAVIGPGPIITNANHVRVTRVVDTILFAKKEEAYILQLADACAFGLRRYFAAEKMGLEFAKSIATGDIQSSYEYFTGDEAAVPIKLGLFYKDEPQQRHPFTISYSVSLGPRLS